VKSGIAWSTLPTLIIIANSPAFSSGIAPGAPTIGAGVPGNALAFIEFTAPSSVGSSAIIGYTASCVLGSVTKTGTSTTSPITISSLTNGSTYACSVTAANIAGSSLSSSSVSITPSAYSPSVKGVLPGDSRISVMYNFIGGKVLATVAGIGTAAYVATCVSSNGGVTGTSTSSAEYSSGAISSNKANYTNPLVVSGLTNGSSYTCYVTETYTTGGNTVKLRSASSNATIPNAGPAGALGILSAAKNTTSITAYPTYASYCNFTNQTATGMGAVPSISYYTTSGTKTTGTSISVLTCSGTTSRTITGNALPDHRSSEFFTNGLTGYTGSPYFSGNPNSIGAKSVNKTIPYKGTISSAYTKGANGYDTAACYTWMPANDTKKEYYKTVNGLSVLRCTVVAYPSYFNNSVKVEPGTAETYVGSSNTWRVVGKNLYQDVGLDPSNAHNQPTMSGSSTNMFGYYHYHGVPEGYVARIGKGNSTMTLIGFAVDGFPIYARYGYKTPTSATSGVSIMKSNYRLRTSAEIISAGYSDRPSVALAPLGTFEQDWVFDAINAGGTLDACNGRFGVTPESPTTAVYHYFVTDTYPFIPRCMFGTSVASWANDTSQN